MLDKIEIQHKLDFDELCSRLRNVTLRGFPEVKIYGNADIRIKPYSPKKIREEISIPQPSIYTPILRRIEAMSEVFSQKGINIFNLNGGYDYFAFDDNNEVTQWTIIPPVVEVNPFVVDQMGFDYSDLIGEELKILMQEKGYELNPELRNIPCPNRRKSSLTIPIICDGSHRVEIGIRRKLEQNLLFINSPEPGFPYYAAPKHYSSVHEEPERIEEKADKTHVLSSPGHKFLYRSFPSGGIFSGTVRPSKEKFD